MLKILLLAIFAQLKRPNLHAFEIMTKVKQMSALGGVLDFVKSAAVIESADAELRFLVGQACILCKVDCQWALDNVLNDASDKSRMLRIKLLWCQNKPAEALTVIKEKLSVEKDAADDEELWLLAYFLSEDARYLFKAYGINESNSSVLNALIAFYFN